MSIAVLFMILSGCEKKSDTLSSFINARIVGFNMNCLTCILEFPDDSARVREVIGISPDNYYQSVNLSKGNYQTGQMLKVKVRRPGTEELKACLTSYPAYDYTGIVVTDFEDFDNLLVNDTVYLSYHDCLFDSENRTYICFESVQGDSRCPTGAYCFWAGNAEVRFRLEKNNSKSVIFDLNTHKGFTNDTIIDNYKFTLLNLSPYPALNKVTDQNDYKAKLLIEKL